MKKQIKLETVVEEISPVVCPEAKVPELEILNPQVEDFTTHYNWLPK